VPVVYHLSDSLRIERTESSGATRDIAGDSLDRDTSASLFERRGQIRKIDMLTPPGR
jgi:hypothetical protein